MIDFHNHIIPNLDDGSKSIEMSLNMLKEAQSQGITDVVNTVHFQHPKMDTKNTDYDFVISEIKKMEEIAKNNNININIHPASEVFFKFNLTEILDNPITTFGDGKYMLIEFDRLFFPRGYEDELFKLQLKNITPIIAHPERYRLVQKDFTIAEKWIKRGYIIQLDCASITGAFGKKTQKVAMDLLNSGLCHLIGSDAHNDNKRNFLMKFAIEIIKRKIHENVATILIDNSTRILNGKGCKTYSSSLKKNSILSKVKLFFRM